MMTRELMARKAGPIVHARFIAQIMPFIIGGDAMQRFWFLRRRARGLAFFISQSYKEMEVFDTDREIVFPFFFCFLHIFIDRLGKSYTLLHVLWVRVARGFIIVVVFTVDGGSGVVKQCLGVSLRRGALDKSDSFLLSVRWGRGKVEVSKVAD